MTVLTLEKRKPITEPASAYLNDALHLADRFKDRLPYTGNEACIVEAIHTITDMRDLIVAALEKMK